MSSVVAPDLAQRLDAALIDHSARRADVEQSTNSRLGEAAIADPRFQLGDPLLEHFAMLRQHLAPARRFRLRIDPERRLYRRRTVDVEEERFAQGFLCVAPAIE